MNLSDVRLPKHFPGIVRLFPLPNLVLYPGVVQALHVFEPRYRKLTNDLLAADQLVSLCLYKDPNQGLTCEGKPAIHDIVCIGKVVAHKELEDGRFNLLVMGVKRASILRELPVEQPYRMAEVKLIEDETPHSEIHTQKLKSELIEKCHAIDLFTKLSHQMDLKKIIETKVKLGLLVDLISFSSDLDCEQRQTILELANVEARCQKLFDFLQDNQGKEKIDFPPDFSSN